MEIEELKSIKYVSKTMLGTPEQKYINIVEEDSFSFQQSTESVSFTVQRSRSTKLHADYFSINIFTKDTAGKVRAPKNREPSSKSAFS